MTRRFRPSAVFLLASLLLPVAASCGDGGGDGGGGGITDPDPPEPPEETHTGTVHPVGGGSLEGVVAIFEYPDGTADTSEVDAEGHFDLVVGREGHLRIDEVDSSPRRYHPFLLPDPIRPEKPYEIVLVPRRWTVRRGVFQGETIDISVDVAVSAEPDVGAYWRAGFGTGYLEPGGPVKRGYFIDPRRWRKGWVEGSDPARVAFDERDPKLEITAEDSALVWDALDEIERGFGRDLFEPARFRREWVDSTDALQEPGVILLAVEEEPGEEFRAAIALSGSGLAPSQRIKGSLEDFGEGGARNLFYDSRPFTSARVTFPGKDDLDYRTVVHEFMHSLGPGHTCRWRTPLSYCESVPDPTPADVAYVEVLYRIMALEREHDTPLSIAPALIGERTLLLDKSPLPPWPEGSRSPADVDVRPTEATPDRRPPA